MATRLFLLLAAVCVSSALPLSVYNTVEAKSTAIDVRSPVLPAWPNYFSVPFSVTVLEMGIIGAPSMLYYDWTLRSQRIDFGLCSANGDFEPCTVIFNGTGAFLFESNRECCQIAPVGCLPPTWTSNLLWNKSTQAYGKKVDLYAGGTPVHDYYNDAMNNPVFLRVEDDDESWTFLSPLQVAPQDPAYFLIPSSCASSC